MKAKALPSGGGLADVSRKDVLGSVDFFIATDIISM